LPSNYRKIVERWQVDIPAFYRGLGCRKCRNTGYLGRIAIHEIFVPDEEICNMVATDKSVKEIRDAAIANGMLTLHHDGIEKIKAGITTIEEVLRVTNVGS